MAKKSGETLEAIKAKFNKQAVDERVRGEIPFRALVTNEISNLVVVGRCISADFPAQAAVRIQPSCMSMGEAAGIASAFALKNNININAVDWANIPANSRSYTTAG